MAAMDMMDERKAAIAQHLSFIRASVPQEQIQSTLGELINITKKLQERPKRLQYRVLYLADHELAAAVFKFDPCVEFLKAIGFRRDERGNSLVLEEDDEDDNLTASAFYALDNTRAMCAMRARSPSPSVLQPSSQIVGVPSRPSVTAVVLPTSNFVDATVQASPEPVYTSWMELFCLRCRQTKPSSQGKMKGDVWVCNLCEQDPTASDREVAEALQFGEGYTSMSPEERERATQRVREMMADGTDFSDKKALSSLAKELATELPRKRVFEETEMVVQGGYQGDPRRTLATWSVPRKTWNSWLKEFRFKRAIHSQKVTVACDNLTFKFNFMLNPNGWTSAQQSAGTYGMCLAMDGKMPANAQAVTVDTTFALLELPTHTTTETYTILAKHTGGQGPTRGLGPIADITYLQSDTLTFTMDLRITHFVGEISAQRVDKLVTMISNYGDNSRRTRAEWRIRRAAWDEWKDGSGFKQYICSDVITVHFQGADFLFKFDLSPTGWTNAQRDTESYGMYFKSHGMPDRADSLTAKVKIELEECPSHVYEENKTFTGKEMVGPDLGLGQHTDIDALTTEFLTFTVDVRVESADMTLPMPPECLEYLQAWRLGKFARVFEKFGLVDMTIWPELQLDLLKEMGMNIGEALIFQKRARLAFYPQQLVIRQYDPRRLMTQQAYMLQQHEMMRNATQFQDVVPSFDIDSKEVEPLQESTEMRTMESTWKPVYTRRREGVLKEFLDNADEALRTETVQRLTVYDENVPEFAEFNKQRDHLWQIMLALGDKFEAEIARCKSDPEYFKNLVIFAKFTKTNQAFHNVLETYGVVHEGLILKEPEWPQRWQEIEDLAAEVKEEHACKVFRQPMRVLLDMYLAAVVTQNRLRELLSGLSMGLQEESLYLSGFKTLSRIWEKMALHAVRRWDPDVWDMSRGMISFETLAQIVDALKELRSNDEIEVIQVHNRFGLERKKQWQDVMVHIRFRDQPKNLMIICEIQLCLQYLTTVRRKIGGHDAYANFRSAMEVMRFVDPDGTMESKTRRQLRVTAIDED